MVEELTALHSYVCIKRNQDFSCNELVSFVKTINLFNNTNSVWKARKVCFTTGGLPLWKGRLHGTTGVLTPTQAVLMPIPWIDITKAKIRATRSFT
jgi:hypothetical protein